MPFVSDPDDLDRNQVIYNVAQKLLYIKGVAVTAVAAGTTATFDANSPAAPTHQFIHESQAFIAAGVTAGEILCLLTGSCNAGHWSINDVLSETTLELVALAGDISVPVDETVANLSYSVRALTGGTVELAGQTLFAETGVSEQAIYSFSKEEWKDDANLIPIEFPWTLITREQGEIGGGTDNSDWDFGNDVSIQLIRTGGWADRNLADTIQREYSGIITLGAIDNNAQVYYQQATGATPIDFVRTGPVNQPILVFTNGGDDLRSFLKLFVRKKARLYDQAEISDIGVSTIETLVNRFPLTHTPDAAIVATDAALLGTTPFKTMRELSTAADGAKTSGLRIFDSAGSTFQADGVTAGDTLDITSGSEQGQFTIESVPLETQLVIAVDGDFTNFTATEGSLSFDVDTTNRALSRTTAAGAPDGVIDVDTATGTLTDTVAADFDTIGGGVIAGDMVIITIAGATEVRGVYKVISQDSSTVLTLNTVDTVFPAAREGTITYQIVQAGMYLENKQDALAVLTDTEYGVLSFTSPSTITRTVGSWITDGYNIAGRVITITGAADEANNGSHTIVSATALVLTTEDTTLVTEGTSITETVNGTIPFVRTVSGVVFGFRWRLYTNGSTLAQAYQFVQHQLRQSTDVDFGPNVNRGDITDLLMSFASPTGTTLDLFPDDIASNQLNNLTMTDATVTNRNFAFISGVTINLNTNILSDSANNKIVVFFDDPDGVPGSGDEYGTPGAIIVQDDVAANMDFTNQASSPISTTFDYDGNSQGGRTPGSDAPVTVVAIGLDNAQFVLATLTIQRQNDNIVSLVSSLERNYNT